MLIYADIDGTICITKSDYTKSIPVTRNIEKINKLYDEGHTIVYWTGRGRRSGIDWSDLTVQQLEIWGCKYHKLIMNEKPHFDLLIDDKSIRIEEL